MNYQRTLKYALLFSTLSFFYITIILILARFVFDGPPQVKPISLSRETWLFLTLTLAPLLETFLFVAVGSIHVNEVITAKERFSQYLVSSAIFMVLHLPAGVHSALLVTVPGLIFGYAYFYAGKSGKESYWLCALAHFLHNLLAIVADLGAEKLGIPG